MLGKVIMDEVRLGDFGDPWGQAVGWCFALAEVAYVVYDDILDGFEPSPLLNSREDLEGYEAERLLDMIDMREIGRENIDLAFRIMDRYRAMCVRAGRDY